MYETSVDAGSIAVDFVSTGSTILALHQMVVVQNDKLSVNLTVDNLVMDYRDGSVFAVTLTDEDGNAVVNATVSIDIDGDVFEVVTNDNGVGELPFNLAPNVYNITATYAGDDVYESASATATVTVNRAAATLSADDLVMTYKDGSAWIVSLTNPNGDAIANAYVTVTIAGKTNRIKTNASGMAKLNINLAPGNYTISASFENTKYIAEEISSTVTVNKKQAVLTADDLVMTYKDGSAYSVTLTDADGNALANKVVKITIGTKTYDRKTDENGVASLPINLKVGSYDVSVKFEGDTYFDEVEISSTISVAKPELSLVAEDINMTYKDGTSYNVQLVDGQGNPYAVAGEIVKITVKGKEYNRKTNANGIASLPINLAAGTYEITAEYDGKVINSTVIVNKP